MDGLRELEQVRLIIRADLPYIGVHPTPKTFKHDFHLCCELSIFLEYQLFFRPIHCTQHGTNIDKFYHNFKTLLQQPKQL